MIFGKRKTDKNIDETLLDNVKSLSIKNKDSLDIYTKMIHSYSYKNNIIKNIINYIPFYINEKGDYNIDFDNSSGNPFNKNGENTVYSSIINEKTKEQYRLPESVFSLYQEDNTIKEIVNQKMIAFYKGEIIPKINEENPVYKNASEKGKKKLDSFISVATEMLQEMDLKEIIEDTKWYPYHGIVYVPLSYNKELEKGNIRPNHRKISITPLNSDFDGSSNMLQNLNYVVVTEKIVYNDFRKRFIDGEYSYLTINKNEDVDKQVLKIWNEETSYTYLSKNFPEYMITRNSSLRLSSFTGIKPSKDNEDINLIGVIDYMMIKDYDGTIIVNTFLNGKKIGETRVDSSINVFPIVFFSESRNFANNLDYISNLSFSLLSSQNTIQVLNQLKKAATDNMAPLVVQNFVTNQAEADEGEGITNIKEGSGEVTLLTVFVKNTNQASNLARVMPGAQVYASYLNELNQLIATEVNTMRTQAGITNFLEGTSSASFESAAGVNAMMVAGLSTDLDIVDSLKNSLVQLAITEAFFELIDIKNKNNLKVNKQEEAINIIEEYRTSLTTAWKGYGNIMDFDFETSYQKQFTQSILQSVIIPMAAQAGQFDIILKLMKELPVTNSMKEQLEELSSDMKERADDNNKVQNSKDSMSKEALLNNTSGNGGTEKTSAKKNKK